MKFFTSNIVFCLFILIRTGWAQETRSAVLTGRLQSTTGQPLAEVQVILPDTKQLRVTGSNGRFTFDQVPYGQQKMILRDPRFADISLKVFVDSNMVRLGILEVDRLLPKQPAIHVVKQGAYVGARRRMIPPPLLAAAGLFEDAYRQITRQLSFQRRGVAKGKLYIDGWPVSQATAYRLQGVWAAIKNAQPLLYGRTDLGPCDYGFPGTSGGLFIDINAKNHRRQSFAGYQFSNGTIRNEWQIGYASGRLKKEWYLDFGVTRQWAKEGYVPGTFYDAYSFFGGVSKVWKKRSSINFNIFGTIFRAGLTHAVVNEVTQLVNDPYYNPCWGFQDGEKRNAHVRQYFTPTALLNYEYTPNPRTRISLSLTGSTESSGVSALGWYDAQNPRPDYYKNLPKYYLDPSSGNAATAAAIHELWQHTNVRQINWDRLYAVNRASTATVNGIAGRRSWYIVSEDHQDKIQYGLSATLKKMIDSRLSFYSGIQLQRVVADHYQKMLDLLGGDFYLNLNQFAERTYVDRPDLKQNDLRHPNQLIKKGDKFDYYYRTTGFHAAAWSEIDVTLPSLAFFIAGKIQWQQFKRIGRYQNGLFPQHSYGASARQGFTGYGLRSGMLYKISGRHYLFLNGLWQTKPPELQDIFISPRYRNTVIDHPTTVHTVSAAGGYLLRSPKLSGQLSLFTSELWNQTHILRFYHDGYRSFVNYVMRGIATRQLGIETLLNVMITDDLDVTAAATWMQFFYTSRPDILVYKDNDTATSVAHQVVYWKNYYATTGPQSVYTIEAAYRRGEQLVAAVDFNYCDRAYETVNPVRLTKKAVGLLPPGSSQRAHILAQKRLPASFFVNLSIGGRLRFPARFRGRGKTALSWHLSLDNVFNNRKMIASAHQQLRFEDASRDPELFPTKYRYALGRVLSLKVLFLF